MVRNEDMLLGMKEICAYVRRSECTVLQLYRLDGLPIKKIHGRWQASRKKIDQWGASTVS